MPMYKFPPGWSFEIRNNGTDVCLVLHGPAGQGAMFDCPGGSVRAIVLSQMLDAAQNGCTCPEDPPKQHYFPGCRLAQSAKQSASDR